MVATWPDWVGKVRPRNYSRPPALVLINGLAEQAESWYRNHRFWRRHFEVYQPQLLVYDGTALHERIAANQPIDVDYLVGQLHLYLTRFVQTAPVHLVASSLGGKVAVEYAVRYPEFVGRMVLLCPSGLGDVERLPIVEGVRRSDMGGVISSVFHNPQAADPGLLGYYRKAVADRRWKTGMLRTVRGTTEHVVRGQLNKVSNPTLLVSGAQDRICDPATARAAAKELPCGQFLLIKNCGHAPQIEKAFLVNRLVVHFLTHPRPTATPSLPQLLRFPLTAR